MSLSIQDNSHLYLLLNTHARLEINRAAGGPAWLIAMKKLESELASVETAMDNNQRTRSMLDVTD